MTKIRRSRLTPSSIRPPLKERATELPIQFAIYVPSTQGDRKLSNEEYNKRVESVEKEMSSRFGGDTSIRASGDYAVKDDEGNVKEIIKEKVSVVEVSMTKSDYEKNRKSVNSYIVQKQGEWNQQQVGYKFEDKYYLYPKKGDEE